MKKLNDRELLDALRQQGFGLAVTKGGFRVTRTDGEGQPVFIHLSNAAHDNGNRAYSNMLADLKRIGYAESEPHKPKFRQTDTALATLQAVEAEPGQSPAHYAAALGLSATAVGQRLNRLQSKGIVRAEGKTKLRRYFPVSHVPNDIPVVQAAQEHEAKKATMSASGRPSAGPVRLGQVEPEDPSAQLRYHAKRLVELALFHLNTEHELRTQLTAANQKLKRLEEKLGSVLDEL